MNIRTLSRSESQTAMKEWLDDCNILPKIDDNYLEIRKAIQTFNYVVRENCNQNSAKKDYYIDVHLGILLYDYLWKQPGFSLRVAANDDFWRYLSVKVVPDVVAERWGKDNESHFWSKPARIWLRSIWWYIHLSWQRDSETTAKILESDCFTTDSILNLEERTGRKGTFINVYRYIMYYYSRISKEVLNNYNKGNGKNKTDLFRSVMKLNTAKCIVIDPALCLGGEKEYVRGLFADVGVRI